MILLNMTAVVENRKTKGVVAWNLDELEFPPGILDGFYFHFHTAHSLSKNSFCLTHFLFGDSFREFLTWL